MLNKALIVGVLGLLLVGCVYFNYNSNGEVTDMEAEDIEERYQGPVSQKIGDTLIITMGTPTKSNAGLPHGITLRDKPKLGQTLKDIGLELRDIVEEFN